jgi:putative transposase
VVRPRQRRETARYVQNKYQTTASRTCRILGLARSTFDYEEHPRDDSVVAVALTDLASQNKRFGHPRLFTLLKREKDIHVNHKRSERIYSKLKLQIKNRKRKKLGGSPRKVTPLIPYGTGDVLAIDFVFDYIESGRRIKILTMVDESAKISPGILIAHSIRGIHLGDFVEFACEKLPRVIRVDQGTEFTSRAFLDWAYKNHIHLEFTKVRKPNQVIESFNSRLRDECLNEHLFFDLEDAVTKINEWHGKYNNYNPHSSLGMMTPLEFARTREIMLTA